MSWRSFFLLFGIIIFWISALEAKSPRFWHADKNKDGVVDRKEMIMERRWEVREKSKVNTWWESRADTNEDGIVDAAELSRWKKLERERIDLNGDGIISPKERRLCWRHARSRVNTALEAKYDVNNDGWLEPEEVKELLKDRYILIKTKGQAKVDSLIEEEYDTDNDGIISPQEARALKEDLGME